MEEVTKSNDLCQLPVKKLQDMQVQASETKHYNENYFLNTLDRYQPHVSQTIYCYKSDEKKSSKTVASVIKDALSKVLVHYYPLAGTLMIGNDGKFFVKCTNKGADFVEAEADCEIDVLGDIRIPDTALLGNLVRTFPPETSVIDLPLLSIQVTRFKCGGFSLGIMISHLMVDGISGMEFVNSWAEIARGVPMTAQPYHDRRVLESRQPPLIKYPHEEFQIIDDISGIDELYEKEKNVIETFTFDQEKICSLKRMVTQDGSITSCTTITILSALIWRSRCIALKMKPNQIAKIYFIADGSKKPESQLPEGYFGNRVCVVSCSCLVSELLEKPLSFAVEMLQNSMKLATWDYLRSHVDYIAVKKEDARMSARASLVVVSWTRLSFHTTDFGWGEPYQIGMLKMPGKEVAFFLPVTKNENGITVLLSLPETAMDIFKTQLQICVDKKK